MPTNTPRLNLAQPVTSDTVSEFRLAISGNATTTDNAAIFLSGTLASRPSASIAGRYYLATDDTSSGSSIGTLYFDTGSAWVSGFNPPSRGAVNIATSQSTSSTSFTTLGTPDQVPGMVLPTNGLLQVRYWATWQESVLGAAQAAIFIGSNQLSVYNAGTANGPAVQAAAMGGSSSVNINHPLFTTAAGLVSYSDAAAAYTGDVTTGQATGIEDSGTKPRALWNGTLNNVGNIMGGVLEIDNLPAGTYSISVQFKASSGSVTASNRRLRVGVIPFS